MDAGRIYDADMVAETKALCHLIKDEMPLKCEDFDYTFVESVEQQATIHGRTSLKQMDALRNICDKFHIEV